MAKVGRPKIVIDYNIVEKLAHIQCTEAEIAEFLGISVRTLQRNPEFSRIHKKGLETGKMSLRRIMWKKADDGNVTMMIWLSKQYLGMRDKQEVTGAEGEPLQVAIDAEAKFISLIEYGAARLKEAENMEQAIGAESSAGSEGSPVGFVGMGEAEPTPPGG
jgi:hypothetical protein